MNKIKVFDKSESIQKETENTLVRFITLPLSPPLSSLLRTYISMCCCVCETVDCLTLCPVDGTMVEAMRQRA